LYIALKSPFWKGINKANAFYYKQMVAQSTLFAYVDAFAIVAMLAFVLIPLPFFMKNTITEE